MEKESVAASHSSSLVQVNVYLEKSVAYVPLGKEICGVWVCMSVAGGGEIRCPYFFGKSAHTT